MATLTNTQISVTYVGLLKTSASTVLSSTAQQITDGSGNNSVLFLSTAGVGIGGAPSSGIEFEVTGNAKITGDLIVDNLTLDASTITSSGTENITLDSGGAIILDAESGGINFNDSGTTIGGLTLSSNDLEIRSIQNDKDIIFKGIDGSSAVTALTLDMSDAGKALFNSGATFGGSIGATGGAFTGSVTISHSSGDTLTLTKSTTEPSLRIEGDTDKDFVITVSGELLTFTQNDGATDIFTLDHDTKAAVFGGTISATGSTLSGVLDVTATVSDAVFLRSSQATTTNVYITNTNATANNTANLYFAPANNIGGAYIRSTAIEDFSSSANRTADLRFAVRKDGTFSDALVIDSSGVVKIEGSENTLLRLISTDANVFLELKDSNSTNGNFIGTIGDTMPFYTNNTLALTIDASQKIKAQTSGGYFLTENTTDSFSIKSNGANGTLTIRDEYNSADRLTINNAGNVTLGAATSLAFGVADFAQITFKESGAITIDSDNDQSSRNFQIKDGSGTSLLTVLDTGDSTFAGSTTIRKSRIIICSTSYT